MARINKPTLTLLFGERRSCAGNGSDAWYWCHEVSRTGELDTNWTNGGWVHTGMGNVAYADGHVKVLKGQQGGPYEKLLEHPSYNGTNGDTWTFQAGDLP